MLGRKDKGFKEDFDTLIGSNATFEGSIELEGTIRVDGTVKGDITVKGDVYVGTEALVNGNISANNVHLAGTIEGNVRATGILKIFSTAKLYGDIEVSSFVTDEGAIFHGNCNMIESESEENQDERKGRKNKDYKKNSVLDQVYNEKEKKGEIKDE